MGECPLLNAKRASTNISAAYGETADHTVHIQRERPDWRFDLTAPGVNDIFTYVIAIPLHPAANEVDVGVAHFADIGFVHFNLPWV
jgi:hypothetical protein